MTEAADAHTARQGCRCSVWEQLDITKKANGARTAIRERFINRLQKIASKIEDRDRQSPM